MKFNLIINNEYDYLKYQSCILLKKINTNDNKSNEYSFLKEIYLENDSNINYKDLRIEFETNTDLIKIDPILIDSIDSLEKFVITKNILIKIDAKNLYYLNEALHLSLYAYLKDKDGTIIATKEFAYSIYPIGESTLTLKDLELFASYVTFNSKEVNNIINEALKVLNEMGNDAFVGYQSNDINNIRKEMCAIYYALNRQNIAYTNYQVSVNTIQKIRYPDKVILEKKGTCIDLAILYCACLENIGLHPVLILIKGHAFAGCILDEDFSFDKKTEDVGLIYNYSAENNMRIELVECTGFTSSSNIDFDQSNKIARSHLEKVPDLFCALDIFECHKGIYKPIPTYEEIANKSFDEIIEGKAKFSFVEKELHNNTIMYNSKEEENKFNYWSKKLLDLSLKNKLINFKSGGGTPQILTNDGANFLKVILNSNKQFYIKPKEIRVKKGEYATDEDLASADDFSEKNIISITEGEDCYKKIVNKSLSMIEETGTNTLYLTVGLLTFKPKLSSVSFNAPIFLIPVKGKKRKNTNFLFEIEIDDDNVMLNSTLFEYLKVTYHFNFSELNNLDKDTLMNEDINAVFNTIRSKTNNEVSILVDEKKCFLTNFSFSNQILWEDVQNRRQDLLKNDIINAFVYEKVFTKKEETIEELKEVNELAIPLGADSSQIKAIKDAMNGESFVLDGPPGTGKSQTIVNMIVSALYSGKSVLFVAEKMAALEVVKKRIDDIKLGKFCLEIHSNKSSKKDVIDQLSAAYEQGHVANSRNFDAKSAELEEKRTELNKLITKLNNNEYGESFYDCLINYLKYKNNEFEYSEIYPEAFALTEENSKKIDEILKYIAYIEEVRGLYKNEPLNFIYKSETFDVDAFKKDIQSLSYALYEFNGVIDRLNELAKHELNFNYKNTPIIVNIFKSLINNELIFKNIFDHDLETESDYYFKTLEIGKEFSSLRETILNYYKDEIFTIDVDAELKFINSKTNKIGRHFAIKKALKKLKTLQKSTKNIKSDVYVAILKDVKKAHETVKKIKEDKFFVEYFNIVDFYKTDYLNLINVLNNTLLIRKDLESLTIDKSISDKIRFASIIEKLYVQRKDEENKSLYEKFIKLYEDITSKEQNLEKIFEFSSEIIKNSENSKFYPTYLDTLNSVLNLRTIDTTNLILFNKQLKELEANNFNKYLIKQYRKGVININELKDRCSLSYYKVKLNKYFEDSYYKEFNGLLFNEKIKLYDSAIDEFNKIIIEETASRVTKNYPLMMETDTKSESSSMGKMLKLFKNHGFKTTIRNILKDYEDIIRRLTPIFLMSPLSAAQYLSIDNKKFDIVVFDEASQIPTCVALGAISRGTSLIVAGDPEQMPPTNFFKTNFASEEDAIVSDDLESLLDDCLVLNMKRNRLLWHYRSEDESLIKFSNYHFYNHTLYTFPNARKGEMHVKYSYVPFGVNDNGINKNEAHAIIKEIKRRFNDPVLKTQSIGVITFNIKQQEYIEKLVEDLFLDKRYLEIDTQNKEQIFIKNLENVQGDERDVILFSVGFAKSQNGVLKNFFGPLSLDRGERRLNVAITRARKEMIVFSSIHGNEIDTNKTKNNGPVLLKDFLNYAEFSGNNIVEEYSDIYRFKSGIETYLADDLRALGYDVDINIGDSKFKVNIGIKDEFGNYKLGIICDSDGYINSPTCRDRNYVQVNILDKLEWKILRVYSLDYINNKDLVIKDILRALESKVEKTTTTNFDDINFYKETINLYKRKIEYTEQVVEPSMNINFGNRAANIYKASFTLRNVLEVEQPIARSVLIKRFKNIFQNRIKYGDLAGYFDECINCFGKDIVIDKQTFDTFYTLDTFDTSRYDNYRVSKEVRDFNTISLVEIKNAMLDILEVKEDLNLYDLIRNVGSLFGIKVINNDKYNMIDKLINDVLYRYSGLFELKGNKVYLKK